MVLSSDTDTEMISKCIEIGADDYLPKPFNPTILRARVLPS
jgi:sigma-B regulation protein RsbU (phosphoserine phosphatase)